MNQLELRRKILHVLTGLIIIFLAVYLPSAKWILFFAVVIGLVLSIASLYIKIPLIEYMLKHFERPYYKKRFPGKGMLFLVAGSLLVLKLFPIQMALAAIAIATFSDPFFSFDERKIKGMFKVKNLRSLFLGLIAGTIAASFFVPIPSAFAASIFSGFIESIAIFLGTDPVDDNIIIPISAGTILYLMPIH
jgi:dolichol kinase